MKKTLARLMAIALVAITVLSVCPAVSAYTFGMTYSTGHTVQNGVSYAKYNVTSKVNGYTLACTTLSFNPSNGFIPMVFSCYAGTSGTMATQYSVATSKYGYNVAGAVNGSFFSMGTPYGTLTGMNISNGKITSAHIGCSGEVVAFGSDGSMNVVNSALKYTINIGGKSYADMIYYINKTGGSASADNWSERFYYYDTSCGTKCDTYAVCPGTEILCKKVDNTDLAVGQTLVGEVISVTKNTYGGSLGSSGAYSDNFILFMRSGSTYENYISGVKAGDTITINTEETVAASKEIMENANSVIPNVGWLVKNGVDRTLIDSTIGTHSVTLQARWTAFGKKADGTYVFFTSEGAGTGSTGSLTLRDVAQAMINMGCTDVIRMDGGGSSAMYVSNTGSGSAGYVQSSSRAVGDGILIVSRSSATKAAKKTALLTEINEAKTVLNSVSHDGLSAALTKAETVYNSSTSIEGDHKRAIMELQELNSGKAMLSYMMNQAGSIDTDNFSDLALDRLDYNYFEGKRILSSSDYTEAQKLDWAIKLQTLMGDTATVGNRLSLGAAYGTHDANASYPDTGLSEMTDGVLFGESASASPWTGYHLNSAHGTVDGVGSYTDITVDLGKAEKITGFGVSAAHMTSWGISAPKRIEVYASADGVEYYLHSVLAPTVNSVTGSYQVIPYEAVSSETTEDRYITFRCFYASNHMFIGELSVYGEGGKARADFSGFNTRIGESYAVIFDESMGALTHTNANLTWAYGVFCNYDSAKGAYVVSSTSFANGDSSYSHTVPSGGIVIGLHGAANQAIGGANLKAGDTVYLTGIDVASKTVYPGARISIFTKTDDAVSYTAPQIGVVKNGSGVSFSKEGYVTVSDAKRSIEQIKASFLDARAVISGNGTGATVSVPGVDGVYQLCVKGDLNGDAIVSTADCLSMEMDISGVSRLSGIFAAAGDMDGSESISSTDYMVIEQILTAA